MHRRKVLFSVALAVASAGCGRACSNDRPYVPPVAEAGADPHEGARMGGGDGGAVDPSALATPPQAGGVEPALALGPGTRTVDLGGVSVSVPGREIVSVLKGDFDGDGSLDALAVVRPAEGDPAAATSTGELVYLGVPRGVPADPVPLAVGPARPADPACAPTLVARLERVGERTAFAELGSACATGTGVRSIHVVRLGRSVASAFHARVTDPEGAPRLTLDARPADRDADGVDDVELAVSLEGGGLAFEARPRLTATLAFFDRPSGSSRDPAEPAASLDALAAQATQAASKPATQATVPGLVHQLRALYGAICAEGGAPRIDKVNGGAGVTCGKSRALESAGLAEVRAYVGLGDPVRAYAAAELVTLPPATRTPARLTELQKLLASAAPAVDAISGRTVNALVDAPRAGRPEWGALSFESNQKLLLKSHGKVSRLDLTTWEIEETASPAWPSEVVSPDGQLRWTEVYQACDAGAIRASFAANGQDGTTVEDILLPVTPRVGARCKPPKGEGGLAVPVAWSARGLEATVSGLPVLVRLEPGGAKDASALGAWLDEAPPRGSPRGLGGRALVVALPEGVLVRTDRFTLRRSPELAPPGELRHCTTTDDGMVIACQKRGRVVVVSFPPYPPP